ncbi:MAG: hypothetical protein IPK60_22765 [Sandaracinaceae bacterium]|nr:hypothetical protein [Sandaracinaceae bacterium]
MIHPRDKFKPSGITRAEPIAPKPVPMTPADRDWCCARCGAEGALCPACHEIVYETPSAEEVAEIKAMSEAYARGELETITVGDYEARRRGRDEALMELAQSEEWKAMIAFATELSVEGWNTITWEALRAKVEGT